MAWDAEGRVAAIAAVHEIMDDITCPCGSDSLGPTCTIPAIALGDPVLVQGEIMPTDDGAVTVWVERVTGVERVTVR